MEEAFVVRAFIVSSIMTLFATLATVAQPSTTAIPDSLRKEAVSGGDSLAQWKIMGNVGLNFSQVALRNWSGGGRNTVALLSLFSISANYGNNVYAWENGLELGYGLTKLGDDPFRKSDDRITLISKASRVAAEDFRYTALVDFRTQFDVGRDFDKPDSVTGEFPKTSNFMAPAYLLTALGIEYKPVDYFSVLLSPLTGRTVIVLDNELSDVGAFGVVPGEKALIDLGSFMNVLFKKELLDNVFVQSRLNLFSRYSEPDKIVVTWENVVTLKVNSYLNATLATDVLYDEHIDVLREDGTTGPATQIRNALAIGLGYAF